MRKSNLYEAVVRLEVFATVYLAALSEAEARKRLKKPREEWGGRIDFEERTARVKSVDTLQEVP